MDAISAPTVDDLSVDTPCIHCGYNLRGLTADGMCPECGRAIEESLRGELLRYANPEWLRKVRLGITVQFLALVLAFAMIGTATGLAVAGVIDPMHIGHAYWPKFVLITWAAFIYTAREPKSLLSREGCSVLTVIRVAASIMITLHVVIQLHEMLSDGLLWLSSVLRGLALAIVYIYSMSLFRSFAKRVPEGKLMRWSKGYIWSAIPVYSSNILLSLLALVFTVHPGEFLTPTYLHTDEPNLFWVIASIIASAGNIATALLTLMYAWLLWRYRRVLGQQIVLADGCTGQVTG